MTDTETNINNIDILNIQNVEKYNKLLMLLDETRQLLIGLNISTFTFDLAQNNIIEEIERQLGIQREERLPVAPREEIRGKPRTPKLVGIENIINQLGPNDFITVETTGKREINTIQKLLFDLRNRGSIPRDITTFSVDDKELIITTGAFDPQRSREIAHIK